MELHYVKIDKDWDDLAKEDSVTFVLPNTSVLYSIYKYNNGNCLLIGISCSNDKIFSILGVESRDFVRNIVGYSCSGAFPEVKSLEDLKKVIKALDDECVNKFGIPDNVSSESKDKYLHPTELKDGDFIKIWNGYARYIYIFKKYENNSIYRHASFDLNYNNADTDSHIEWGAYSKSTRITYATDEEKNLLLETLAKKGYVWNYTTKQLQKVDTITLSNNIGTIDIPDQINSCCYDTIGGVARIHTNVIYPAADITGLKEKSKEELNLFPTKKHYQLNFNY